MKTDVAIIGGGPAGMLLSQILDLNGISSIVLERQTKEYVLGRIRAGVLEQGTVEMMSKAGIGDRIEKEGFIHESIGIGFDDAVHSIDVVGLTNGSVVTVYGQTELTKDLYQIREETKGVVLTGVEDVQLYQLTTDEPYVTCRHAGENLRIDCDFIAGCDGFHGPSRQAIPVSHLNEYHLSYPYGWLGVLSETPPVCDEVVYSNHERGFALCSMRNKELSRYYIQVPSGDRVSDWSDDDFWKEFKQRVPNVIASTIVTGPSIEKSIAPLRAFVADNLNYGRLFLAGDAGHIVPPTGAKGLNLAVSDVYYLSEAFKSFYKQGSEKDLSNYSSTALRRIWKTVRFSLMCTKMLHLSPQSTPFEKEVQKAEIRYLLSSKAAMTTLAENYVGLPY